MTQRRASTGDDVAAGTRGFETIARDSAGSSRSTRPRCRRSRTRPTARRGRSRSSISRVPAGARPAASPRWRGRGTPAAGDAVVRVTLFAPDGTYVANSRPQGGAATAELRERRRAPPGGRHLDGGAVLASPGAAGYSGVVGLSTADSARGAGRDGDPGGVHARAGREHDGAASATAADDGVRRPDVRDHPRHVGRAGSTVGVGGRPDADRHVAAATARSAATSPAATRVRSRRARRSATSSTSRPASASLNVDVKFANNPHSVVDLVLIDPNGELSDVVTNETLTPNHAARR